MRYPVHLFTLIAIFLERLIVCIILFILLQNEAYRSNLGILVLVHVSLALMNISVCVFIAIS